jgi:hypothetical protein
VQQICWNIAAIGSQLFSHGQAAVQVKALEMLAVVPERLV